MHRAITLILIYIVNPPRRLHLLMNEICSWFFTQDIQYRFVYFFIFLYLYYRALSFLLIRSSLSVFKIFTTFNVPRVKWKNFFNTILNVEQELKRLPFGSLEIICLKSSSWWTTNGCGGRGAQSIYMPKGNPAKIEQDPHEYFGIKFANLL